MNELKIGQRVYYSSTHGNIPKEYYIIDSEEMTDYGFGSTDEYYYFKELPNEDTSRNGRLRAWKPYIITLDTLIVCSKCGSTNIIQPVWQDPNTKEVDYSKKSLDLHIYCKNCKDLVVPYTREEWEESKKPIVL